jgi:hypothetical protein
MNRIRGFLRLSSADRKLFFRAVMLVGAVRLTLVVLPYRALRLLFRRNSLAAKTQEEISPARLVWAVRAASRIIPGATCLTQALSLQLLMCSYGRPSRVQIGVAKNGEGFQAHAWVEHAGTILLNTRTEIAPYARIVSWEEVAR